MGTTELRTRSGAKVEVLATLPEGKQDRSGYAIVGLLYADNGTFEFETWMRDGKYIANSAEHNGLDLVMP